MSTLDAGSSSPCANDAEEMRSSLHDGTKHSQRDTHSAGCVGRRGWEGNSCEGRPYVWLARGAHRPLVHSSRVDAAAIHAECSHGVHGPASLEELLLRQHCPLALLLLLRLVLLLLRLLLLLLLLLKQQGPCIHLHHKKKPVTVRPLLQLKCSQLLWLRIKPRCAGKHSSTLSLQGSHQDAGTSADVAGLHCKLTCSCGVWPNALRFWSSLS